jgi:hypothetical protein
MLVFVQLIKFGKQQMPYRLHIGWAALFLGEHFTSGKLGLPFLCPHGRRHRILARNANVLQTTILMGETLKSFVTCAGDEQHREVRASEFFNVDD